MQEIKSWNQRWKEATVYHEQIPYWEENMINKLLTNLVSLVACRPSRKTKNNSTNMDTYKTVQKQNWCNVSWIGSVQ